MKKTLLISIAIIALLFASMSVSATDVTISSSITLKQSDTVSYQFSTDTLISKITLMNSSIEISLNGNSNTQYELLVDGSIAQTTLSNSTGGMTFTYSGSAGIHILNILPYSATTTLTSVELTMITLLIIVGIMAIGIVLLRFREKYSIEGIIMLCTGFFIGVLLLIVAIITFYN